MHAGVACFETVGCPSVMAMDGRLAAARFGGRGVWAAVIGVLCATLALELIPVQPSKTPVVVERLEWHKLAPPLPKRRALDDSNVILRRPLFSVHRRPAAEAARIAGPGSSAPPRLSGIVITPAIRRAIFDGDGKVLAGNVGDHIGPYTILAIYPRRVTLTGPTGVLSVSLSFSGNPQATPAPIRPSILDRLNGQRFRPPALPNPAIFQQQLLRQQAGASSNTSR